MNKKYMDRFRNRTAQLASEASTLSELSGRLTLFQFCDETQHGVRFVDRGQGRAVTLNEQAFITDRQKG
jgi:hypothetical protein